MTTALMMLALMWLAVGGLFAALGRVRSDEMLERTTRIGMPVDLTTIKNMAGLVVLGPMCAFIVLGFRHLEKSKQMILNVIHDGNVAGDGAKFDELTEFTPNAKAVFASIDVDMHKDDVDRLVCVVFMMFNVKIAHQDAELLWRNISSYSEPYIEMKDIAVKWLSIDGVSNDDIANLIASYVHHKTGHELERKRVKPA